MLRKLLSTITLCFFISSVALAQTSEITGTVTEAESGDPLPGVNVVVVELSKGAATNADGEFTIPNVPTGSYTIEARFVGFRTFRETIELGAETYNLNISLQPDVLGLDEVVVTGVSSEQSKKKLAFSVARLGPDNLSKVPSVSAVGSLSGKVAGAQIVSGSGQPGSGTSVMLRGAKSITGNNQPLYIVDGVILGSSQVDLESLDIESIEVLKGAAAASLYGSRAQNGVIQIKTNRGDNLSLEETRITLRNEFGVNSLQNEVDLSMHHQWMVDDSGNWLDANGNVVKDFADAALDDENRDNSKGTITFQDNEFPGKTYDHIDRFFDPGNFYTNFVSIGQNTAQTNFYASFNNLNESGVIGGLDGYQRQSVRVNLDHKIRDDFSLGISSFYSTSNSDDPTPGGSPNPFFGLMFMNPNADLTKTDDNGELVIQPDPRTLEENPLYLVRNAQTKRERERILGSFNVKYTPADWFDIEANFSYDRSNRSSENFRPVGFKTIDAGGAGGDLSRSINFDEAINSSVTAAFRKQFGKLGTNLKLRALNEQQTLERTQASGSEFLAEGVKDLGVTASDNQSVDSRLLKINSQGYFGIVGFDYDDKYIGDFLVRRDGSSLFGPDERWATYFRGSFAYRISEESFWPLKDLLNEFKVRYSYGTAGGRPGFSAQYETFNVGGGQISKQSLGNKDLKPELTTEQEFGVDFSIRDRISFELTYATSTVEDQLLQVPLSASAGFNSQWQNAGDVETDTYEATVNASLIRSRDITFNAGFVFDKTTQEITEFNRPAYRTTLGTGVNAFYNRQGETFGAMYGDKWIESVSGLPSGMQQYADQFEVNDDGYLVAVGDGNSWQDGIGKGLWGTTVDVDGDNSGDYDWGMPIKFVDEEGNSFTQIGSVVPDFNLGFNTNFRYKDLSIFMVWNAQIGGDIYNNTRQWPYRDLRHGDIDQAGKSDQTKKPTQYYEKLYNVNAISSHFVEDGTYIKLRELSIDYTFDSQSLTSIFGSGVGNAVNSISLGVVGRNLLTFTDYSGFDPEVGGGSNATVARVDAFGYPNFRTITGKLEIQF